MARLAQDWRVRRDIASRMLTLIEGRHGSFYQFEKQLRATDAALASTVHNWLPPFRQKERKEMRQQDWEKIRLPNVGSLLAFCRALGVRAGYVLDGEAPEDRWELPAGATVTEALAAALSKAASRRARRHIEVSAAQARGLFEDMVGDVVAQHRVRTLVERKHAKQQRAKLETVQDAAFAVREALPHTASGAQALDALDDLVRHARSSLAAQAERDRLVTLAFEALDASRRMPAFYLDPSSGDDSVSQPGVGDEDINPVEAQRGTNALMPPSDTAGTRGRSHQRLGKDERPLAEAAPDRSNKKVVGQPSGSTAAQSRHPVRSFTATIPPNDAVKQAMEAVKRERERLNFPAPYTPERLGRGKKLRAKRRGAR